LSTTDARPPAPRKGMREIIAIFWSLIGIYLLAALVSWSPNDSGWSRLGEGDISNTGGAFGAWLSDVLINAVGQVAILIPAFIFIQVVGMWRKEPPLMGLPWRMLGLFLALLSLGALAGLHFSQPTPELPNAAGGFLGLEVARSLSVVLGVFGGTLLLIAVALISITVATGLSWFWVMDVIGHAVWDMGSIIGSIFSGQFNAQREAWRERRAMKKALEEAAPLFELALSNPKVKAQLNRDEPARTEPVLSTITEPVRKVKPKITEERVSPVITPMEAPVKKSERAQKEKQRSLFDAMPVSGDLPSLGLLDAPDHSKKKGYSPEALEGLSRLLEIKLKEFNVDAAVVAVHPGPVITRFEIQPAPGVKVARITNIAKDLARSLAMISVRVVEVIPGKSVVGIEVPNEDREMVRLSEILSSETYESKESPLTLALGKDIAGKPVVADLARMPHLLVAGTTGSGKSVGVNAMLLSILYKGRPEDVRLILIDPKMLELSVYDKIPHLLTPVVTDMKDAANALRWSVGEMERRYKLMAAMGVRNLAGFNKKIEDAAKNGETIPTRCGDRAKTVPCRKQRQP
jgi:S-DNA-T family DNA segregation ATPase FtsK/SpoIIIE